MFSSFAIECRNSPFIVTEVTSTPTRSVEKVFINNESHTGKKHTNVRWDDSGK